MLKKLCINIEDKRKSSEFSYNINVIEITSNFIAVVTAHSIYHGCSTQKMFWEDNFSAVNMKSCGSYNVSKHNEIKNGE